MFVSAMEHGTPEALNTYLQEHPKADRSNHSVKKKAPRKKADPKSEASAPTSRTHTELTGILKPSPETLETVVEEHKAEFDKINEQAAHDAESFKSTEVTKDFGAEFPEIESTDFMSQTYPKLSKAEKIIHVAGHKVGERFEKSLSKPEKNLHDRYLHNWHTSAGSWDEEGFDRPEDFNHDSQELQGWASSLGVSGHAAPEDEVADKVSKGGVTKARAKAAKDVKLSAYAKKMYDYQQAYFKNAGLKEITLYRGVKGPGVDGAVDGSKVKVQSRELSSFTADPNIAKTFGRVIEFKVPVERVFASSLVRPLIGSETSEHTSKEAEFLIMGASDLEGQTIGKPITRDKTASAKVIEVPISNENADWLNQTRKREKSASIAARVVARYLSAKAKGVSLVPEFKDALVKLEQGEHEPAIKFARRVVEVILPDGVRPPWFTALSVQKMNAINSLYKEARRFSEESGAILEHKKTPEQRMEWMKYMAFNMAKWAKDVRTLELASVIADVESEITHGPFTIVPISGLTRKQVEEALAALDVAAGKVQLKFPKVLYGKVFLSQHLKRGVAAWYDAGTDSMALNVLAKKRFDDVYTIIHELGHRHDFKFASREGKRKFWDLSTRKVYEKIPFDAKLREQLADECVEMVKKKALGQPIPPMSENLVMWLKSPYPHQKGDVRNLTTAYLQGKLEEKELHAAIKGKEDVELQTNKILHGPLAVTPYGATKPIENYAEGFAHFVLGLDMPPELAAILADEQ
jgi:hypothetical protein